MQSTESIFSHPNGSLSLEAINGIHFTRREIDIIACILGGRTAKKIGSVLSISPKTVENHIRNIMLKLSCGSQENIIDFIERSNKYLVLKNHYSTLLLHSHFKKKLKEIASLIPQAISITLVTWKEQDERASFISQLEKDLSLLGVKVASQIREKHEPFMQALEPKNLSYIYLMSEPDSVSFIQEENQNQSCAVFLLSTNMEVAQIPQEFFNTRCIDLKSQENYYLLFFAILSKLWPSVSLDESIAAFKTQYDAIHSASQEAPFSRALPSNNPFPQKNFLKHVYSHPIIWAVVATLSVLSVLVIISHRSELQLPSGNKHRLIRSDLPIPNESTLLKRPILMAKLEEKMQGEDGIETVVLVGVIGIGGAGKTTLARQFGRAQDKSLVWELNAKGKTTLYNSFKDLAYALAKTSDQRHDLDLMQKIEDSEEKEKLLLTFVKKQLKEHPNWLLIFDNVGSLPEIKKYIPQDPKVWGQGKLILTSRNGNIKNSGYVKPENILEIGELTEEESLRLFCQIIYNTTCDKLTPDQKGKASSFLKNIPPFPLDVSVAAYYIKSARLTYDQYLERIRGYSQQFDNAQKNLMREVSDYAKTRYGIITSSLERLLEENPSYKDLMFFICLLDSQNIPINLLEFHGESSTVDRFIFDLRRTGMMTGESSHPDNHLSSSFSLHRSTQILSLDFLSRKLSEKERQNLVEKMVYAIVNFYEFYRAGNDKQGTPLKELTLCYARSKQNTSSRSKIIEISSQNLVSLTPHLETVLINLEEAELPKDLKENSQKDLLVVMGYIYYKCVKNLSLAKDYFSKALAIKTKSHSFANYTQAVLLKNLGVACSHLGDYDKALFYAQASLRICEEIKNPEILAGKNLRTIGTVYYRLNDFKKSKNYFKAALNEIVTVDSDLKKYLESDIYEKLAALYSARYINREEAQQAKKYIHKSLAILDTDRLVYNDPYIKKEEISWQVLRHKNRLGQIYCRLGKYEEAFKLGYREVEYIIRRNEPAFIPPISRARLDEGIGEVLLRTGDLRAAEKKLTESIDVLGKLAEKYDTLYARVFRTEARIRLAKFNEAYEDCSIIFKLKYNFVCSYRNLMNLTAFYHAAVIKCKQGDFVNSLEHFSAFFEKGDEFCRAFLTDQQYQQLQSKNVFPQANQGENTLKVSLKDCLRYSVEIFSEIYGGTHPFVRDYVIPNYQGYSDRVGDLH